MTRLTHARHTAPAAAPHSTSWNLRPSLLWVLMAVAFYCLVLNPALICLDVRAAARRTPHAPPVLA